MKMNYAEAADLFDDMVWDASYGTEEELTELCTLLDGYELHAGLSAAHHQMAERGVLVS